MDDYPCLAASLAAVERATPVNLEVDQTLRAPLLENCDPSSSSCYAVTSMSAMPSVRRRVG